MSCEYDLRSAPIGELTTSQLSGRIHLINDRERSLLAELEEVRKMRKALFTELDSRHTTDLTEEELSE